MLFASLSFLPAFIHPAYSVIGLAVTGVVLDFCVQMNMVLGQRAVYALDAKSRSRLNALYMTSIFIGGAFGSSVASAVYEHGGWLWIVIVGSAFRCWRWCGFECFATWFIGNRLRRQKHRGRFAPTGCSPGPWER
jgi:predicted MFS family arabinose efflux permease